MIRLAPALAAILSVFAFVAPARADSLDERFDRAVVALAAHHPEIAVVELRALVALGVDDPDVYTNLGIAEAESMHYGRAMVAFERALSLRPRDEVASHGLENATTLLARRIGERTGTTAEIREASALESFARSVPEPVAAYALLAAIWIACVAFGATRLTTHETRRIAGFVVAAFATVGALLAGTAVLGRARLGETIAPAIVVRDRVEVVSSPDPRAPTITTLDEGTRVTLSERHGGWARIRIDGRSRGWVARDAIGTY